MTTTYIVKESRDDQFFVLQERKGKTANVGETLTRKEKAFKTIRGSITAHQPKEGTKFKVIDLHAKVKFTYTVTSYEKQKAILKKGEETELTPAELEKYKIAE